MTKKQKLEFRLPIWNQSAHSAGPLPPLEKNQGKAAERFAVWSGSLGPDTITRSPLAVSLDLMAFLSPLVLHSNSIPALE